MFNVSLQYWNMKELAPDESAQYPISWASTAHAKHWNEFFLMTETQK